MKNLMILLVMVFGIAISKPSYADNINPDCDSGGLEFGRDTVTNAFTPPTLNANQRLPITVYRVFVGEPVGAPTYVVIVAESHDGRDCWILEDQASQSGGLGIGFGDALVEGAFILRNDQEDRNELFVPVRPYAFATGDEVYEPRLVGILVEGSDSFSLSLK